MIQQNDEIARGEWARSLQRQLQTWTNFATRSRGVAAAVGMGVGAGVSALLGAGNAFAQGMRHGISPGAGSRASTAPTVPLDQNPRIVLDSLQIPTHTSSHGTLSAPPASGVATPGASTRQGSRLTTGGGGEEVPQAHVVGSIGSFLPGPPDTHLREGRTADVDQELLLERAREQAMEERLSTAARPSVSAESGQSATFWQFL